MSGFAGSYPQGGSTPRVTHPPTNVTSRPRDDLFRYLQFHSPTYAFSGSSIQAIKPLTQARPFSSTLESSFSCALSLSRVLPVPRQYPSSTILCASLSV